MKIRTLAGWTLLGALAGPLHGSETGLDWLAGRWCGGSGDAVSEEVWLKPSDGETVGMNRTLREGKMVAFEFLRIVSVEGQTTYIAQPGGRAPTHFEATSRGPQWIRFENPRHDFPQSIGYRRDGDTLHAEIAGPGEDGAQMTIPFRFTPCP